MDVAAFLALIAALTEIRHILGRARRSQSAPVNPWGVFLRGRTLDGRRDTLGAFRCNLHAAHNGLPVAAVMAWVAYRVGDGVLIDPVAADAWALRATALGWPEGVLEIGDDVNSHQQKPGGRMTGILTVFGLAWFNTCTVLTYGTLTKLIVAKPPRQSLRREWMSFHADAVGDFLHIGLKVLWVFSVVMVGWPYFLWWTLRGGASSGR